MRKASKIGTATFLLGPFPLLLLRRNVKKKLLFDFLVVENNADWYRSFDRSTYHIFSQNIVDYFLYVQDLQIVTAESRMHRVTEKSLMYCTCKLLRGYWPEREKPMGLHVKYQEINSLDVWELLPLVGNFLAFTGPKNMPWGSNLILSVFQTWCCRTSFNFDSV